MSICTDGIDSYSKKKDKIEESFIKSFEDNFLEEDDYMSMNEFTVNSPVGTRMTLADNTDVVKLPAGVLVRTEKSNSFSSGGVAVHTIYLTDEQYFGAHVKKA